VSRFMAFDGEKKYKTRMTILDSQEGFRAARSTLPNVTDQWLDQVGRSGLPPSVVVT